jgi:hypothetical protein
MHSPEPAKEDIYIGMIEHSARDDQMFHLRIKEDGTYFVQIQYSPNRPYSRPSWSDPISPGDFQKYFIDGVGLEKLLEAALRKRKCT